MISGTQLRRWRSLEALIYTRPCSRTGAIAEKTMRKLVIIAAALASLSVAACNTVEGAGKDVSSAGRAVSDTAKDAK